MCIANLRLLLGLLFIVAPVYAEDAGLESRFVTPPDATKPRCYWYWMDGHIDDHGITRDLEAMRGVGIGEAYIGVISGQCGLPADPKSPQALSAPWWAHIEHAVREGARLGVDIGLFNSPGWSQSGGPWIKAGQSMRYVVLPEMRVTGPQSWEGKLPTPTGDFSDVAVVAFPAPLGDDQSIQISQRTPNVVTFASAETVTVRSITIHPKAPVMVNAELQASEDGKEFRTIKRFDIDRHNPNINVGPAPLAPVVASFPATAGRIFRLNLSAPCELGDIQLSPAARVEDYASKSLLKMFQAPQPPFDFYSWPQQAEPESADLAIRPDAVLDLSKQMASDGTLRWDVPPGQWVLVRAVMTPTSVHNSPAPPEATGLEVDKMSRTALRSHFDAYVGHLLRKMPEGDRKALKHVVADSYETGPENWTDGFKADFLHRYGYDPVHYLPVMTGRIVGSADQSNRFLWDVRRLVADRIAHDYVGGLRDLCHEHGLQLWLENYGHWGFPAEFLQYGGQCDGIGGEFWVTGDLGSVELRDAASCAHLYGMPVVWAEAFTGGPSFVNSPRELKARGDWAFCEGINQFVLHVYIHQPWEQRRPGVNAPFGTEFNRHNTWFGYAKPWIDYQRRCSVLLQAGQSAADVAYYIGEDTPKMTGACKPALPSGYDFDFINADVIENRLAVRDGQFILPDGVRYRVLVLPASSAMRPAVLKKIRELVLAGGTVVGPAPTRSPSLQGYPACDKEVKQLADALWGQGRVLSEGDLTETFRRKKISPDVVCAAGLLWKHRSDGDKDIYFLSNQKATARTETVSFRIQDRIPEFWWPENGCIEPAAYQPKGDRIEVAVPFSPTGSVFVVFRPKSAVNAEISGQRISSPSKIWRAVYGAGSDVRQTLAGPWRVTFRSEDGGPAEPVTFTTLDDWSKRPEPSIRYYSGTAVYRTDFQAAETKAMMLLDLGAVHATARVRVNGREVGTVWKEPYVVNMGDAIKAGTNTLEVEVVNTWLNRLVGDEQSGVENPITFATSKDRSWLSKETPLQPAGLLGPVRIFAEP